MNEPLVSVIIPVYSGGRLLGRAIDSALMQNLPLEIIVINDNSPEDIDTVMESYQDNAAVLYVKNSHNMGAAESRNKGVLQAKGRYIAFLDADDCWADGKLSKQLAIMEQEDVCLCATAREMICPDGQSTGHIIPIPTVITYRDLLKQNCINCSSVMLKKEVALEFPMHHAQNSHEDYIMWLEILRKYGIARGINEPLLLYTASNQGKSGSKWQSAKMTWRVYRYMGFGLLQSAGCFVSYALHGVWKHYISK